MELTPLRAAGLVAAVVFAALTLRAYRQGKFGNGDLLLRLVVFVLPLRHPRGRSGDPPVGLRRALVPPGRRAPDPGRHGAGGRHPLPVRVHARRPRGAVAARPHPPHREPRARAVPRDRAAGAVRRRRRRGHPGLQRGATTSPTCSAPSRRRCAATSCMRSSSTTARPTTRPTARALRAPPAVTAAAEPRPGGGAPHRLPARARDRRRDRRHDGRRRPAPALGAVAARRADRRGRGRRGRRLSRARRRRPVARRARDGHQALRPPAVAPHLEQGHRPGVRLPGGAHVEPARPRVPPGPVPQLRVHRRGVEEAPAHDRGAGHRHEPALGAVEEAAPLPLRHGLRQRARCAPGSANRTRTRPRCAPGPRRV